MRTARAPTTALSGKNISEDSLAISTAILAAPYAVLQPDSSDVPASSGSEGSQDGEPIDNAMALDEATSALGSLALEWAATSSFFVNSIGSVGAGGWLSVGVADDEEFFQKYCMVDGRPTECRRRIPRCYGHVGSRVVGVITRTVSRR